MDLRRLRIGEWIAAAAGVVLLVTSFLRWYDISSAAGQGADRISGHAYRSAWQVFSAVDVLMAVEALLAIGLLVLVASAASPSVGISAQALAVLFTGVVALVVLIRFANIPDDLTAARRAGVEVDVSRTVFAYLGVLAAVAIPVGLVVALRDERLSKAGALTDGTGVPVASAPDVETLPAPRP